MPKIRRERGVPGQFSVVKNKDKTFTLLPGKAREGHTATKLGEGVFKRVKLARDEKGQTVAVGVIKLKEDPKERADQKADIDREVEFNTKLGRECTLIYDDDDPSKAKKMYFFQPYLSGQELGKYLEENLKRLVDEDFQDLNEDVKKMSEEAQVLVAMEVLSNHMEASLSFLTAIKEMHDAGIIHCDLHPGNVLYQSSGHVSNILDFGLSHILEPGSDTVLLPGKHPVDNPGLHIPVESRAFTKDGKPMHSYAKSSDIYAFGFDIFAKNELVETITKAPCLQGLGLILKEMEEFNREHLFNARLDANYNLVMKDGDIQARSTVEETIDQFHKWQREIVEMREHYHALTEDNKKAVLEEERMSDQAKLALGAKSIIKLMAEHKKMVKVIEKIGQGRSISPRTLTPEYTRSRSISPTGREATTSALPQERPSHGPSSGQKNS